MLWGATLFFVALPLLSYCFAVLTPSLHHLGSILAPLDPIWAGCWPHFCFFWCQVGAPLGHLDARKVLDEMKYSCLARRNARSDPPPNGDGVLDRWIQVFLSLPDPSKAKFLISISGFPLPNPLPEAAHSARPRPDSPGYALLALLGRKNRVPRGLQKMINL